MKKFISLLLITVMTMALVSCGGNENALAGKKKSISESTETKEAAETVKETEEKDFSDRECASVELFKVYYPKDWSYDEESTSDSSDYCRVVLYIGGEDFYSSETWIYIMAENEDGAAFRHTLSQTDVVLESYADGSILTMPCGGVMFAEAPIQEDDTLYYIYRHEPSQTTYSINIGGDYENAAVKEVLEGIELTLSDNGGVDSPWPWDGVPFAPVVSQQTVGSYTIVPEVIAFEESLYVMDIMEHQFAVIGNKMYHLFEDTLTEYDYSGTDLKKVTSTQYDKEYEYLSYDNSGMLYLSQGIFEGDAVKDHAIVGSTITHDLVMHPSGEWGITSWVSSDVMKVTNNNGSFSEEPWVLTNLNIDETRQGDFAMIDDIAISDSHIIVAGLVAGSSSTKKIGVYDYDGNKQLLLGGETYEDPDCLGAVTGIVETANGYVAADGNMRKLYFWEKDGTFIGTVDSDDIFGTDYPWFEDMQLLDDGSILLMLTQERFDESADELLVFRLTGF